MTLQKNNWPLQKDATKIFGPPACESNLVLVVPPFDMFYEDRRGTVVQKQKVRGVRIHKLCAVSLGEIFAALKDHYGTQQNLDIAHVSSFSGGYNNRVIRGSTNISMHAYGVALDFDAENNPMTYKRDVGFFNAKSPIVQTFKAAGWFWGGDWSGRRDPMHFQAARV